MITVSSKEAVGAHGRLLDAAGRAVPNGVLLFVGSAGRWLAGSDDSGFFGVGNLPSGDYRVYALADDSQFALLEDPQYLNAHQNDIPPVHLPIAGDQPITILVH